MAVAAEEARTALALALAQHPGGNLPVPDIAIAHSAIYTRLEGAWVDACQGDYLVVQAKLAVLKLMADVCGVNAALKASKQKLTNRVNSEDMIEHMQKLGMVVAEQPAEREMPRRSVELDEVPPVSQKPPSGRW
jgi:predicted TIM-barrel fold metal-dependent hydrolase